MRRFKVLVTVPHCVEVVVEAPSKKAVQKWFASLEFSEIEDVIDDETAYHVPEGAAAYTTLIKKGTKGEKKTEFRMGSKGEEF
jgi:hypothetical protein